MRQLMGAFFILHGLGHAIGVVACWTRLDVGFRNTLWMLPGKVTLRSPIGAAFGMFWLVAMVGWIAAGAGTISGTEWWPALGAASAVVSIMAMAPWWDAMPPSVRLGLLADVVVLVALISPLGRDLA